MTEVEDIYLESAPWELQAVIPEFWPEEEYRHAAQIAFLESGFEPLALNDSTDAAHPCGAYLRTQDGVKVTAERSVGYFQINSCNYPMLDWHHLYNARANARFAHALWERAGGWSPWYFSASRLGLL